MQVCTVEVSLVFLSISLLHNTVTARRKAAGTHRKAININSSSCTVYNCCIQLLQVSIYHHIIIVVA